MTGLWDYFADQRPLDDQYGAWRRTEDGQEVYTNVRDRALRLRARGWQHFGIKALWEAARYDRALAVGPDAAGFKMNNNLHSRMARELMASVPELADFFELRRLRS